MKPKLYQEYENPKEIEAAYAIVDKMKKRMVKEYEFSFLPRDFHCKGHGFVKAEFTIENDLPEEYRHGLFEKAKTYEAWIRFSSSLEGFNPDKNPDARGFALKVVGVKGEKFMEDEPGSQDFIMFSIPFFFSKNTPSFLKFLNALHGGVLCLLSYFLFHWRTFFLVFKSLGKTAALNEIPYFSASPYRYGEKAAKFCVTPQTNKKSALPKKPIPNYLRLRLREVLEKEDIYFDFKVQFQKSPVKQPIEDVSVTWSEKISPFFKVATIRIPKQVFDSKEQMDYMINTSYNPWHALKAHQPLGGINRARRIAYEEISKFRHEKNKAPFEVPTPGLEFGTESAEIDYPYYIGS